MAKGRDPGTTAVSLREFLSSRRSIRRFTTEPIERATLERILTSASFAPSAHNRQPWRYVVITDLEQKQDLAEAMGQVFRDDLLAEGQTPQAAEAQVRRSRERITGAPVLVILCADFACADDYRDADRRTADSIMLVQDTAMGGLQFMLAAHAEGLGTVWMCAPLFAPETVRASLDLPAAWEPQSFILVGYPADIPAPRERQPLHQFARFL